MLRTDFGKYKYLGLLAVLSVTFELISNFIGARLVTLGGVTLSLSIYSFPMVYLIADVLTEVYGYSQARNVLWLSIFCRILTGIVVWLLLLVPPSPIFSADAAYQQVLSSGLRLSIAAMVAVFAGDICNSYVLAKMKIWSKGKHLWARFVVSTFVGEGINTVLFYVIAFYGVMPTKVLIPAIVVATFAKTMWEVIALPVTYPVVSFLKKVEGVDHYDRETDFNPFITDASEGRTKRK